MWKWILFVAIFAGAPGASANEQTPPRLSLEDPYSLKWAVLDNPAGLRVWARQQFMELDPEKDGGRWILAVATYLRVHEPQDNTPDMRRLLSKALELSAQYDIPRDALFTLQSTQMEFHMVEEFGLGAVLPPGMRDQQYRERVRLAEQLNLPGRKGLTQVEWGQFMLESGRESEGIKKMHEAMRELGKSTAAIDLELMQAKELYAAGLVDARSNSKSKMIYTELEQFCNEKKLRYFCLLIDHDYAYLVIDTRNKGNNEEAFKALQRALAGAEELNDQSFIATVSNSLTYVLDLMGRYEEAKNAGLRALAIFKKQNDGVWLADTQLKLASVLLKTREPDKALEFLTVASQSFPSDYYWDQTQIAYGRARAYRMLNQPQKSFESLLIYAQALKANASRNQNAEIAQNLTQINLELEEEQSRSLTEAEVFQKIQTELDQSNRVEQQNTLFFINIIWIISGFLIASGILGLVWIRQQNRRIIRLNRHLREDILQRFLPAVIAEKVASGQAVLDEIPHEQEITALFGRLVGLEHAIEDLGPRVVARLLESLMQAVTDVSIEHHGCLDKLHRGSFLILFGAPIDRPADEQIQHAIAFAHSIQQRFNQIRDSWPAVEGWRPGLAIGIHQGPALVGVFGGKRRADYTAIGQTVNLAARIEGEAKSGEIMVSEKVADALSTDHCRSQGDIRLKGISKPQKLFIIDPSKIERTLVS